MILGSFWEESNATNVEESDNNAPCEKNATQPQEQIKPIKAGTNWTAPRDCDDYDEKLRLNMPEGILARFSNPIKFFEVFF